MNIHVKQRLTVPHVCGVLERREDKSLYANLKGTLVRILASLYLNRGSCIRQFSSKVAKAKSCNSECAHVQIFV